MKMISLKCPHCHADLEISDGLDTFYCQYCGGKIILEGMSKAAYRAKVRAKELDHEEKLRDKEIEQEQFRLTYESKEKHKLWIRESLTTIGVVIIVIGCLFLSFSPFSSSEKKHDEKIAYLQELENQIETDFNNGNYDSALFKANQLYCDDNWSTDETAAWDAKRKAYIKMIEAKMREVEINNPDNIFIPSDSNYFKGKNATDVEAQFYSLGFSNIKLQPASEEASFFHKSGTIEHILIGGKTDFTTEDYFDKDSPIIIYYYSKYD